MENLEVDLDQVEERVDKSQMVGVLGQNPFGKVGQIR